MSIVSGIRCDQPLVEISSCAKALTCAWVPLAACCMERWRLVNCVGSRSVEPPAAAIASLSSVIATTPDAGSFGETRNLQNTILKPIDKLSEGACVIKGLGRSRGNFRKLCFHFSDCFRNGGYCLMQPGFQLRGVYFRFDLDRVVGHFGALLPSLFIRRRNKPARRPLVNASTDLDFTTWFG